MSNPASAAHEVPGEARASLERLLASEVITRAPRVKAVLQYLVDCLVAGRLDDLNEQTIGRVVFHRPAGYNPAEDNIVRVTISNARGRLEHYYSNEGQSETWLLDIPRGRYIPSLHHRESSPLPEPKAVTLLPGPAPAASPRRRTVRWAVAFVAALIIMASIGLAIYSRARTAPRTPAASVTTAATTPSSTGLVQELFFHRNQRVSLVVVDSNLESYREIFQRIVPLDAYLSGDYDRGTARDSQSEKRAHYYSSLADSTSVTSAVVATRLERAAFPELLAIRHPHDMSLRDMERDNEILLGGPWINPWGQLFENRLNFRIVPDPKNLAHSRIENINPAPGEPKLFYPHAAGTFGVSYARIALVPNLSGTGKILMLGANDHYSLEAAGDFVISSSGLQEILDRLGAKNVNQLTKFEIVLQVTGIQQTPDSIQIIAHRPLTTGK
jgi:hypothetical protein